jgi:hypothetical protein
MFEHLPVSHLPSNRPLAYWTGDQGGRLLRHYTLRRAVQILEDSFNLPSADGNGYDDIPFNWMGFGFF